MDQNSFKKVECNVSKCNLCGNINICNEDKIEHANLKHNREINIKDKYNRTNERVYEFIS